MKIIGNGLIAKSLIKKLNNDFDCIIFASGVSDSKENNLNCFDKEKQILLKTIEENKDKKIVYFSSIFINRNSFYYNHKKEIEKIIENNCNNFTIFRLPQIVGLGGNNNNIYNFFKNKIKNNESIDIIKNSKRALVDVDDLVDLVFFSLEKNWIGIINLVEIETKFTIEIVEHMASLMNKKINYNLLEFSEENVKFKNSKQIVEFLTSRKIKKEGYINSLLKKYIEYDQH